MKLNHLHLHVSDVQHTASFFEQNFGFSHVSNRSSPATAILHGEGGFVLVLQKRGEGESYPESFHFGFLLEDEAAVLRVRERLLANGVAVGDVTRNGRGTLLYVRAPGDLCVEVSWHR